MEFAQVLHPDDDNQQQALNNLALCMEKLVTGQKQSVRLFYLEEKCYKEVAELTGYTLGEVKSYIQNGKRNLKLCLEKR